MPAVGPFDTEEGPGDAGALLLGSTSSSAAARRPIRYERPNVRDVTEDIALRIRTPVKAKTLIPGTATELPVTCPQTSCLVLVQVGVAANRLLRRDLLGIGGTGLDEES